MSQIKQYYQDRGGNVTVEYDNGVVENFSLTKTVTAESIFGPSAKLVVSNEPPNNADGQPDGTIYIHTGPES